MYTNNEIDKNNELQRDMFAFIKNILIKICWNNEDLLNLRKATIQKISRHTPVCFFMTQFSIN